MGSVTIRAPTVPTGAERDPATDASAEPRAGVTDSIVVIRSRYLRLAKTIHVDGTIEAYGQAKRIDLFDVPLPNLDTLCDLLVRLLPRSSCAVVFGSIIDLSRTRGVRRLAYPDPETDDQPTLRAVAHWWCAFDFDGVERPESVPASDLAACATLATAHLPREFHGVRCIVQASASHGIKPGCRLRLWFWLSRPTTGDELGFWLKGWPVDPCTFRAAQPIYTGAPVFVGREDHLPCRIVDIPGAPFVSVPSPEALRPARRPDAPVMPDDRVATSDSDVPAFIDATLDRLRGAGDNGKHYALRSAARLLGGIQAQAGFADSEAVQWLMDALPRTAKDMKAAEKTARWGLDVGRRAPIKVPSREPRKPDPRRKETAHSAFRLLRMGIPSDELLRRLHDQNSRRVIPLSAGVIADTVLWAARQAKERAHAR
jgi:hypothetical protein